VTGATGSRKLLAGFLTVAIGIGVYLAIFRRDINRTVPLLDGSTITIVPGIYLIGNLGPAAAYVVETSDGLILIDSGLDDDAQPLKTQMAKLGLDWKKLRAIFLTHVHGDHCGGAEHLRTATKATVYAGEADVPILRAGGPREAIFSTYDMPHHATHATTVDVALAGDETIAFGNVQMRVLGTPGHTPGSTCYLIERAGLRVLFAGDVIQGLDERPLGTYSAYLAPRYRGDAKSYLASLQALREMPVPDLLLPGHPNSSAIPRSPQLSSQRWAEMLDDGIDDMRRLVEHYEADGANFLDGHPKQLLPGLYYLGDFQGSAIYGFFADSNFFVVNAPGGTGLSEFLKTRLKELGRQPVEPTAILLTACGDRETAGLAELVQHSRALVVASSAGIADIKKLCPPETIVVSADELPQKNWFPVTPLPLGGRGTAPIAYLIKLADKNVLFAGNIPADSDANPLNELLKDLAQSRQNALAYNAAVQRLAKLNPDLWLPVVPYHGRNANVYGNEWEAILEKNRQAAIFTLQSPQAAGKREP
jgi:glyoxylase-like metal-dependent hydrolase (beta-lactamase superfamily II)